MSWPSKNRGNSTCFILVKSSVLDDGSDDVGSIEGAQSIINEWESPKRKG